MKKLVIKLTPEQEDGIREVLGLDRAVTCGMVQVKLEDRDIEMIKAGHKTEALVYVILAEGTPEDPVFLF